MIWYNDLYLSDNIRASIDKYRWKLEHNAGMVNMYVVCLSQKEGEQLDIFSTREFMRPYFDSSQRVILGMARGYDNMLDIIELMAQQVYDETGNCNIKDYFQEKMSRI